jgi:preprotein translocase subunit SecY
LKLNMAGVIPPIFASSILLFPATIAQWFGQSASRNGMVAEPAAFMICRPGQPLQHRAVHGLIVFFCFFYTALVFNPKEVADNLKKSGAYVPGIRPGEQTANTSTSVLSRLTLFGAAYIAAVCLLPQLIWSWSGTCRSTSAGPRC